MIEAAVLKTTYLAGGLNDAQLTALGALAEVRSHHSGYLLAGIGEPAAEMYLVLNGEVIVTTADGDALGTVTTGQLVGEVALVDDRPRAANVVCVGHVTVGAFKLKDLRRAIMADKEAGIMIMANIARVLAMRLRNANSLIDSLSDKIGDTWDHATG